MGFAGLSITQWDVVRAFAADNIEAGVKLLGKYSPAIRAYLKRKGFENDADDMTQLVYIKVAVWIKRDTFGEDKGAFRGMILACIHQVISEKLRKRPLGEIPLDYDPVSKSDQAEWHDVYFAELINEALLRVKERVNTETWLAFVDLQEGNTPIEVAKKFGRQAQWAYDVKSGVLKMLKEISKELDLDA